MIPVAPPAKRVALRAGDEAFCLLVEVAGRRSRSGAQHTVKGVARVRVESIEGDASGDVFHVVVVASRNARTGKRLTYKRGELYATHGDERRAFGQLVTFLWGGR